MHAVWTVAVGVAVVAQLHLVEDAAWSKVLFRVEMTTEIDSLSKCSM